MTETISVNPRGDVCPKKDGSGKVQDFIRLLTVVHSVKLWNNSKAFNLMATHSSVLSWKFPCPEEPGRLQSLGCKELHTLTHTHMQLKPKEKTTWARRNHFLRINFIICKTSHLKWHMVSMKWIAVSLFFLEEIPENFLDPGRCYNEITLILKLELMPQC